MEITVLLGCKQKRANTPLPRFRVFRIPKSRLIASFHSLQRIELIVQSKTWSRKRWTFFQWRRGRNKIQYFRPTHLCVFKYIQQFRKSHACDNLSTDTHHHPSNLKSKPEVLRTYFLFKFFGGQILLKMLRASCPLAAHTCIRTTHTKKFHKHLLNPRKQVRELLTYRICEQKNKIGFVRIDYNIICKRAQYNLCYTKNMKIFRESKWAGHCTVAPGTSYVSANLPAYVYL